jgi:type II secretory pathway component PulK
MTFLSTQSPRKSLSEHRRASRGISTIAVILSMSFIVMAVAAMTGLFNHETRRTRATLAQTQLRQLLLAAVPAAQAELNSARQDGATPPTRDITLQTPLPDATVTLHVQNNTVRISATYRGYPASQTLTFSNGTLVEATLESTSNQ